MTPSEPTPREPNLAAVRASLEAQRSRVRASALLTIAYGLAACVLAALLIAVLGDAWIRFPGWMRGAQLLLGLFAIGWALWRWLGPASRFTPSLTQVALRVESREPALRNKLAAAVELEAAGHPDDELNRSVASGFRVPDGLIDRGGERRLGVLASVAAGVWVVIAIASPGFAGTGLARVLTPWTDAAWPKRTDIVDFSPDGVHPAGVVLPVRAVLAHSAGNETVRVRYRVVDAEGRARVWRSAVLAKQKRTLTLDDGESLAIYETLVETGGLLQAAGPNGEPASIEYELTAGDDRTQSTSVTVAPPPEVTAAVARVRPPAYVEALDGLPFLSGEIGLGSGSDETNAVGPLLAGSTVDLALTFNKNIPAGGITIDGVEPDSITPDADGNGVRVAWSALRSANVRVVLEDEFGLTNAMPVSFGVEVVEDAEPSAVVLEPQRDESVLPTAIIPLTGEARDDVALRWVALEAQVARADPTSDGNLPVNAEPRTRLVSTNGPGVRLVVKHGLELESLEAQPGDEIRVFAVASDVFEQETDDGIEARDPVESLPRILRVIDETEFIDEVLSELGAVRRAVIRVDEEQSTIERRLESAPPTERDIREQAAVGDSVRSLARVLEDVGERIERNALDDEVILGLVQDAADAAERAAGQADRAAAATQEQRDAENAEDQERAEREGERARERVRDELERLAGLLDRGEDSWAVRRALEQLIESQRALSEQTQRTGATTQGRSASELTPEEQTALDKIAQRQLDAAERARELLDELSDRAEEMEEVDAGQSAAMRSAAARGRESRVSEQLRQAGESVSQNQISQAGQQQQGAQQALEQMLQDLDEADAQRNAELQRILASLIESLEGLINRQKSELSRLAEARGNAVADPALAEGMAALHSNTLGVIDDVRGQLAELLPVADQMETAAEAQAESVVPLREVPTLFDRAETLEQESLAALEEALRLAEEAQQQAEQDEAEEQRQKLLERYGALLEEQVALRADTQALGDERLNRRERADARALGQRQLGLVERIDEVRVDFPELNDSPVFSLTHERIDASGTRAGETLRGGTAGRAVVIEQSGVVRLLQGLIEALQSEQQDPEEFREGGGGAGEGGQQGGQGMIPPIAELKALRLLQQEALDLTRLAADGDAEVETAAEFQRRIAEEGNRILEQLQNQQGPAPEILPNPEAGLDEEVNEPSEVGEL